MALCAGWRGYVNLPFGLLPPGRSPARPGLSCGARNSTDLRGTWPLELKVAAAKAPLSMWWVGCSPTEGGGTQLHASSGMADKINFTDLPAAKPHCHGIHFRPSVVQCRIPLMRVGKPPATIERRPGYLRVGHSSCFFKGDSITGLRTLPARMKMCRPNTGSRHGFTPLILLLRNFLNAYPRNALEFF